MNITIEKIDEFKNKAEDLIRKCKAPEGKVDVYKFLIELYKYAVEQTENYIPKRLELSAKHSTGIDKGQLDYHSVFMAILLISWAVRMREVKSVQGQCHVHSKDCSDTRKIHSDIYDQWIKVVEETLEVLKADRPG